MFLIDDNSAIRGGGNPFDNCWEFCESGIRSTEAEVWEEKEGTGGRCGDWARDGGAFSLLLLGRDSLVSCDCDMRGTVWMVSKEA